MARTGAWPDGLVDVVDAMQPLDDDEDDDGMFFVATCGGCGAEYSSRRELGAELWAQSHAGRCRAVSRPGGGR